MTTTHDRVQHTVRRLHAAAATIDRAVVFMEVCGTHTMSVFRSGLGGLLPENVSLLAGPGCPVCVTAQGDIDLLIGLALDCEATLCTYGDMLRVPGTRGSLERARSDGADVRAVYSAMDAVALAEADPSRQVVFAAVGFETTAPASAAAIIAARRRGLRNFSLLVSHKRIVPAMTALLDAGEVALDGFLLPGHVSVIIGADAYGVLAERYGVTGVIAGFEPWLMADALLRLTESVRDGRAEVVNLYPQAVDGSGNVTAQRMLEAVFVSSDATWRGMGVIPRSGLAIREAYSDFDAARRFGLERRDTPEPPGCRCGEVIRGAATPPECRLFGGACTPVRPLGPCMVSSEGACQAWFKYHRGGGSRKRPATPQPMEANA